MHGETRLDAVRRSNRFRVVLNLPVKLGLKDATLVDISEAGILATHVGVLKAGAMMDVSFTIDGHRFHAPSKVETCTVVGLGAGPGGATLYASRLFFRGFTDESREILLALLRPDDE